MHATAFESLSPVLPVDRVEPSLSFWKERLGFDEVASVPDDGGLAFAMLARGNVTVMYQTRTSIERDDPAIAEQLGHAALYVKVDDLESITQALAGAEVLAPPHETFYGMREISVREPGGHVVTFAQPIAAT